MADTYKITQLAVYNPQRLDDDTFIDMFIARTKVFDYLVSQLKEEDANSIAQHHLIIGARGMGKTMLLKRIEIELKSTELNKTFIPILYPEDQYNITGLDDLWLNSLDKVADVMDYLKNDQLVNKIDIKVDALQGVKNKEGHEDEAYEFFTEITSDIGKRPVLLIDNINLIFKRLDKTDQHRFRNLLSKKNAPIIIAASPVKVKDALDYGAPFYDAFHIQYLQKINDDELLRILNKLAELTGNTKLILELRQKISRIRVINQLTGGVPRTSVLLFKLISRGFSNSIIEDLDALLDDITPLYKARFEEELSDQLQTIMNAIALNWDPVSIEKLRTITGLSNSKLSPQLKRLTESGWIVNKPGYKTKGKVYEVSERFFNIWYLMRQSSRRQKRQVLYLSRFLESIYGEEIKTWANRLLTLATTKSDHILYNLAVAECISEKDLKKQIIDKCRKDLSRMQDISPELRKEFESILKQYDATKETSTEELTKSLEKLETKIDKPSVFLANIARLKQNYEKSEKILKEVLGINPKDADAWFNLGYLYQAHLSNYEESEKCYKKALEIDPKLAYAWNGLGNLYQDHLKQYEKAKESYLEALNIEPDVLIVKLNLIFLLRDKLGEIKKAKEMFESIKVYNELKDSYYLNAALFDLYEKNVGLAEKNMNKALDFIGDKLPTNTQDDWWRFAAVTHQLGYDKWLLNNLEEKGYDKILSPYYVAIKALSIDDGPKYLSSKAVEIRDAAKIVLDKIKEYL